MFLQEGGRPAFRIRLALAGTLSPCYGIYNGFELCENAPIPGREEYIHSEKYEYKVWDWDRPGNIKRDIAILNRFRRDNPALHELTNLRFLDCPDPNILAYAKATADRGNIVIAVVNLDPHGVHGGEVVLPLQEWGIDPGQEFCARGGVYRTRPVLARRAAAPGSRPADQSGAAVPRAAGEVMGPIERCHRRPGSPQSGEDLRAIAYPSRGVVACGCLALPACGESGDGSGMSPPDDAPAGVLSAAESFARPQAGSGDPLWYKDAIIYQLHVKAFFDANNDGIGDFEGLTRKLDYLQDLGVTALWLLPFYPSPLRDDGYDIADYKNIHPAYGRMADFKAFVREAHRRGLRVITELVDQPHLRPASVVSARAARAARLAVCAIFTSGATPTRNSSKPGSSFSTPRSRTGPGTRWRRPITGTASIRTSPTSISTIRGCSARSSMSCGSGSISGSTACGSTPVPYLIEREGTNNENLPETHEVLRRLRAELDSSYDDRMLLAEANQWPEDVLQYFGDGDECHMAFHFPLMPRIYMAVATEDRHPITDIMRQTPEIPETCQWAMFLRNHDELTLEMVTDRERDYLWNYYAADRRARINLGIRRRLAPLMENDRRKIELLKGLLLSMPGTPVLYYGDEIGMGDNVFLGDRDGVRTPMQWSFDRNGGFSRADPASLYLPPIMDPVYGFEAVNVEAQSRSPASLLNWTKRLIAARRTRRAFGRGALRFLYPTNRKVIAYLREWEGETILSSPIWRARPRRSNSISRISAAGSVIEVLGRSEFPPIGEQPYLLTLQGHSFFWFELAATAGERSRARPRRRNSSRWSCRMAGAICSRGTTCRSSNAT